MGLADAGPVLWIGHAVQIHHGGVWTQRAFGDASPTVDSCVEIARPVSGLVDGRRGLYAQRGLEHHPSHAHVSAHRRHLSVRQCLWAALACVG